MVKNRRLGRTEAGYEELTSYIVMSAIGPEFRLVSFNPKIEKTGKRGKNQRGGARSFELWRAFSAAKYVDRRDNTSCTEEGVIDIHHVDRSMRT